MNGDNFEEKQPKETMETTYLHNKGISKLPLVQFKLITIRKLFLQNNFLNDLTGLESLPLLQYLDVSFNHIQVINSLHHCHILEELIADQQVTSNNYAITIDPRSVETLKKTLVTFHCAGNNLDELRNIGNLQNLKHLDLSCNKIDNLLKLTKDLSNLKNLKTINLFENSVVTREHYVRNVIGTLPKIEQLDGKQISPNLRYHCMLKLREPNNKSKASKSLALIQHLSRLCDPLPSAVKNELLKTVLENNRNYTP